MDPGCPLAAGAQCPNHWTARELLSFLLIQDFSEWRQGCRLQLLLILMHKSASLTSWLQAETRVDPHGLGWALGRVTQFSSDPITMVVRTKIFLWVSSFKFPEQG